MTTIEKICHCFGVPGILAALLGVLAAAVGFILSLAAWLFGFGSGWWDYVFPAGLVLVVIGIGLLWIAGKIFFILLTRTRSSSGESGAEGFNSRGEIEQLRIVSGDPSDLERS